MGRPQRFGGNDSTIFTNAPLLENQNPRQQCRGFCGVGRPPITFSNGSQTEQIIAFAHF